jgi:hypothetical protein
MSDKIDLHALYSSWDSRQLVTALKYHGKESTDRAVSSMIAAANSRGLSDADYSQTSEEMAFQNDVRKANAQASTNAYLSLFGTLLAPILF